MDSNHWTPKRTDLQSVAIATMRLPHFDVPNWWDPEPMKGLEPPTGWLQISYSTNWVTSAFSACQTTLFLLIWGCKDTTFFQTHQNFFSLSPIFFHNNLIYNTLLNQNFLSSPSLLQLQHPNSATQTAIFHAPSPHKNSNTHTSHWPIAQYTIFPISRTPAPYRHIHLIYNLLIAN